MRLALSLLAALTLLLGASGCGQAPRAPQGERAGTAGAGKTQAPETGQPAAGAENAPLVIELTSAVFTEGGAIPSQYSCDGENVSPPLAWGAPPAGTRSFALIMDDPDALHVAGKVWDHWVLYNLPAETTSLPEAVPTSGELANGARQGNGSSGIGYNGPCPPRPEPHHYHFKIFALDTPLDLPAGATKDELLTAMKGHVLGRGELIGIYARK